MTTRRTTTEDLENLTDLGIRSKASWGYSNDQMAVFRAELTWSEGSLASRRVYAIQNDELSLLGYYSLKPIDRTSVKLEHIFVDPEYFGLEIGRHLFDHARRTAACSGCLRMTILSDSNAAGFYDRVGCRKTEDMPSSIPGRTLPVYTVDLT